jgi:hypothetical protein
MTPDDNTTGNSTTKPQITAYFSEDMDSNSLSSTTIALYECSGGGNTTCKTAIGITSPSYNSSSKSVTFTPKANLQKGTWYRVTISTNQTNGAKDKNGKALICTTVQQNKQPSECGSDSSGNTFFLWRFKTTQ